MGDHTFGAIDTWTLRRPWHDSEQCQKHNWARRIWLGSTFWLVELDLYAVYATKIPFWSNWSKTCPPLLPSGFWQAQIRAAKHAASHVLGVKNILNKTTDQWRLIVDEVLLMASYCWVVAFHVLMPIICEHTWTYAYIAWLTWILGSRYNPIVRNVWFQPKYSSIPAHQVLRYMISWTD